MRLQDFVRLREFANLGLQSLDLCLHVSQRPRPQVLGVFTDCGEAGTCRALPAPSANPSHPVPPPQRLEPSPLKHLLLLQNLQPPGRSEQLGAPQTDARVAEWIRHWHAQLPRGDIRTVLVYR